MLLIYFAACCGVTTKRLLTKINPNMGAKRPLTLRLQSIELLQRQIISPRQQIKTLSETFLNNAHAVQGRREISFFLLRQPKKSRRRKTRRVPPVFYGFKEPRGEM